MTPKRGVWTGSWPHIEADRRRFTPVGFSAKEQPPLKAKQSMNDTIEILTSRRSVPPPMMTGPAPTADELATILTVASRVPDHGKLAPWRFLVFAGQARERASRLALDIRLVDKPDLDEAARAEESRRFVRAPLVVAVVSRAAPHPKIPEWEQILSAGAVCMNMIVASRALGFSATWLTEWMAYDGRFRAAVGLAEHERVAGFLHIGRTTAAIEDRPRPPLAQIVTNFPE
jgi:nitroreductase